MSSSTTVLPAKSDSDDMFCLQHYKGLIIDIVHLCINPILSRLIKQSVFLDFSLTVKAATLIFISGYGSAISSAKEGKSGFIYNLVKSK